MEGPEPVEIGPGLFVLDLMPMGIRHFLTTYILRGREVAIVDCGPSSTASRLIAGLEALGVRPSEVRFVLATHIHIDHVGGASAILEWAPDAELLVHAKGVKHMADPRRLWESTKTVLGSLAEKYGPIGPVDKDRISGLREGEEIEIPGWSILRVLETPGHASHHVSFFEPGRRLLFPGDSAGIYIRPLGIILPTTPPPHKLDLALSSLDKQAEAGPETICYAHSGQAGQAVEKLRAHRRQLELWARIVGENLEEPEERILKLIAREDPNLAAAEAIFQQYPLLIQGLMRSVRGLKDYLAKRR